MQTRPQQTKVLESQRCARMPPLVHAWPNTGLDASSFATELDAVLGFATAATQVTPTWSIDVHVTVITDNAEVGNGFRMLTQGHHYLPEFAFGTLMDIRNLLQHTPNTVKWHAEWVPSHGKREEWRPRDGRDDTAKILRALN